MFSGIWKAVPSSLAKFSIVCLNSSTVKGRLPSSVLANISVYARCIFVCGSNKGACSPAPAALAISLSRA